MKEQISILGAGLVGSLSSLVLSKKGYPVKVYEKRKDPRGTSNPLGRSVNLALSERGLKALEYAGIKEKIMPVALPMYGRMIHDQEGKNTFQRYSSTNNAIYSITRHDLNCVLIKEAENAGAEFLFENTVTKIDFKANTVGFRDQFNNYIKVTPEICLGADGAFSELRTEMIQHGAVNYSQEYLAHGYKELQLPSNSTGKWNLEKDALHIWPRKSFMMIALPNLDGSFTCTLFLSNTGLVSFETIGNENEIKVFFEKNFPDLIDLIPDYVEQFQKNPVGKLVTIKTFPWTKTVNKSHYAILGDSAHAIVPFYGQGMNCGFEDVRILLSLLEKDANWKNTLMNFENLRKKDTDAIAEMALLNFIEMRDLVTNPESINKKKEEEKFKKEHPEYLTSYEKVSFSNIPYSEILAGYFSFR